MQFAACGGPTLVPSEMGMADGAGGGRPSGWKSAVHNAAGSAAISLSHGWLNCRNTAVTSAHA